MKPTFYSTRSAIKSIIIENGTEILDNSELFWEKLSTEIESAPDDEKAAMKKAILESYVVCDVIEDFVNGKLEEDDVPVMSLAHYILVDSYGMNSETAEAVIDAFCFALNLTWEGAAYLSEAGSITESDLQPIAESDPGDFEVEDGAVKNYIGNGGDVVLPKGITRIYNLAFSNGNSITSMTLPDTVTEICASAFSGCTNMKKITIPNSVKKIGMRAFFDCASLVSIVIPDSVERLESETFMNCIKLARIVLPSGLLSIGEECFSRCMSLTRIDLPTTLEEIDNRAFHRCISLNNVVLPAGLRNTGVGVFYGCNSLTMLKFPDTLSVISESMFESCKRLASVNIPTSIRKVSGTAFKGCRRLTQIFGAENVRSIGPNAFSLCGVKLCLADGGKRCDIVPAEAPKPLHSYESESIA